MYTTYTRLQFYTVIHTKIIITTKVQELYFVTVIDNIYIKKKWVCVMLPPFAKREKANIVNGTMGGDNWHSCKRPHFCFGNSNTTTKLTN